MGRGQARWEGRGRSERQELVWGLIAAAAKSDIAAGGRGAKVEAAQPLSLADHRTKFKLWRAGEDMLRMRWSMRH